MCGISGKISLTNKLVTSQSITQMNDAIRHRGPDDAGVYVDATRKVGLGHRRLAIIDLSPLGHQPMAYLGRYQIVFNGEIYNYLEQRRRLERMGYKFKSQTDTEVIIALYDKHKEKCVNYLRGMFAFAVYDQREQILFCARDRIGKKPFKYYYDGKVFLFASELKAIVTQSEYKREVDYTAIHHYLTLQYTPAPLTGFVGIQKLEPAHYLSLNIRKGTLLKKRYWQLDFSQKQNLSEEAWCEVIRNKLEESVKIRLMSDVPLGAFLSGGVDSSAIVAMMSKLSSKPVKTFSIGFEESGFNELPYARKIADQYHTEHTEFVVQPHGVEILPKLVWHYEEPYADSSALPTYYVSELTRKHVTVALNGDGGDESFGGYSRYSIQKFSLLYNKLMPIPGLFVVPSQILANQVQNTFTERLYRFSRTLATDYRCRYTGYTAYFTQEQKLELYSQAWREKLHPIATYELIAQKFDEANTTSRMDQMLYADIATYLPDALMTKVDIASMAVGLEGRSPFLDHEFMELTASIPSNLKIKGLDNKKYILKKALEGVLPHEIIYRSKRGFSIPISAWFKGDLREYAHDTLLSQKSRSRGYFNMNYIEKILEDHATTKINYGNHIWALLTLELWFQTYFD